MKPSVSDLPNEKNPSPAPPSWKSSTPLPNAKPLPALTFGLCGGCQYQHLNYPEQLRLKTKQLRDTLQRLGSLTDPDIRPIIASPLPLNYRNRISVHQEGPTIGFKAINGRDLVDVRECLLATPEVNRKLAHLRAHPGQREHYSLRASHIPELGFFQANDGLLEQLRQLINTHLAPEIRSVIECYAGAGFFAQAYAERMAQVILIEQDSRSLDLARRSFGPTVICLEGSCEEHLPTLLSPPSSEHPTACIVDPPREGLSDGYPTPTPAKRPSLHQLLLPLCNPATLARDLKALAPAWRPLYFQPIDLFPQTAHIECLVSLTAA
ncbi:MAG: class I SAM-dependent RNA methyltransferase [Blastochloris sp.]|nr:class I SAM-dependent RNA methyltransferase [Blastochloris sp.]